MLSPIDLNKCAFFMWTFRGICTGCSYAYKCIAYFKAKVYRCVFVCNDDGYLRVFVCMSLYACECTLKIFHTRIMILHNSSVFCYVFIWVCINYFLSCFFSSYNLFVHLFLFLLYAYTIFLFCFCSFDFFTSFLCTDIYIHLHTSHTYTLVNSHVCIQYTYIICIWWIFLIRWTFVYLLVVAYL